MQGKSAKRTAAGREDCRKKALLLDAAEGKDRQPTGHIFDLGLPLTRRGPATENFLR